MVAIRVPAARNCGPPNEFSLQVSPRKPAGSYRHGTGKTCRKRFRWVVWRTGRGRTGHGAQVRGVQAGVAQVMAHRYVAYRYVRVGRTVVSHRYVSHSYSLHNRERAGLQARVRGC